LYCGIPFTEAHCDAIGTRAFRINIGEIKWGDFAACVGTNSALIADDARAQFSGSMNERCGRVQISFSTTFPIW